MYFFFRKSFRQAFGRIRELQSFLPDVQNVALTATLTAEEVKKLPGEMGFLNTKIIQETPDRPNIYLAIGDKESRLDVVTAYEHIYQPLPNAVLPPHRGSGSQISIPIFAPGSGMTSNQLDCLFGGVQLAQ